MVTGVRGPRGFLPIADSGAQRFGLLRMQTSRQQHVCGDTDDSESEDICSGNRQISLRISPILLLACFSRRPLVQIRSSTETKLRRHVDTKTREECKTPISPLKPSPPGWKPSCTTFCIMSLPASGPHWSLAANGPQLPQLCNASQAGPVVREARLCRPILLHTVQDRSKSVGRRRLLMP